MPRVVVGKCQTCGRDLRVVEHGVRARMHLTCKCGVKNIITPPLDLVEKSKELRGNGETSQADQTLKDKVIDALFVPGIFVGILLAIVAGLAVIVLGIGVFIWALSAEGPVDSIQNQNLRQAFVGLVLFVGCGIAGGLARWADQAQIAAVGLLLSALGCIWMIIGLLKWAF
jgi:hypothetical protein